MPKETKEKIEDWEKEFDKIWITPNEFIGSEKEPVYNLDIREKELKSFIRQLLAQEKQKLVEEIEEIIFEKTKPWPYEATLMIKKQKKALTQTIKKVGEK